MEDIREWRLIGAVVCVVTRSGQSCIGAPRRTPVFLSL
jgi:hypothetical protein